MTVTKNTKKHILFIVENSLVPIDVRVWSEALAAKEWGYDVTVLCPKWMEYKKGYEVLEDIKIFRHPWFLAKNKIGYIIEYLIAIIWEIIFSVRIYLKTPFHIIHGANPPDHLFLIACLFKPFGVKYIFDHHDLTPESYYAKYKRKGIIFKVLLYMEKINYKIADLVISTNESYKSIAIKRGGKNSKNVFVVRNGPKIDEINFQPQNPKWKKGFDYLVAYIGLIGLQDQLEVLLQIVYCIVYKLKVTNIKFIVIGDGSQLKKIMALANSMYLIQYIEFTGFITYGRQLFEIFSTSDVCINPEKKNCFTDKSTMIKIMEYMSFGKPIIQFDNKEGKASAGNASLYIKNNSVMVFAEELVKLVQDEDKKKKMGIEGKKRIKNKLQWNIQKINLKKAYKCLIDQIDQ